MTARRRHREGIDRDRVHVHGACARVVVCGEGALRLCAHRLDERRDGLRGRLFADGESLEVLDGQCRARVDAAQDVANPVVLGVEDLGEVVS